MRASLTLCLFALLFAPAHAQIQSPLADFSDSLVYITFPEKDPYFVFHTPDPAGVPVMGSLEATYPAGTTPFDFTWTRWDTVSASFQPYWTENGDKSSIDNLDWGCYRVHISSLDTDTLFRAWIFRNDPRVELVNENGLVKPYNFTCDYLVLESILVADTILYYDLTSNQRLSIPNNLSFEWTSDNDGYEIPGATVLTDITIYNNPPSSRPPTKDTRFTLTAVDSFGLSRSDEVLYESVHVRAEFKIAIEDDDNPGQWTEQENPSGEAPLLTRFRNFSENGVDFKWVLVDSAKTGIADNIITLSVEDSVEHTYYYPGYYFPKLYAYSEGGCVDSFPLVRPIEIQVEHSVLDVMNVFTPNGDTYYDVFKVHSKSLKNFRITIYNRNGKKVYEYEQREEKLEWEGWDGTIFGKGNRFAESGVYFYVIEALGWDGDRYRKHEPYKGFIHLYR